MTSKYIKDEVNRLVGCELEEANKKFPMFASNHEGFAVLLEESDEARDDLAEIKINLNCVWDSIKANSTGWIAIDKIEKYAENLACEALQIAVMARKYRDSANTRLTDGL